MGDWGLLSFSFLVNWSFESLFHGHAQISFININLVISVVTNLRVLCGWVF